MMFVRILRFVLHLISAVGLLVAVCFNIAAVLTPAWQVVFYAHLNEWHHHGLWETCIKGGAMSQQMGRDGLNEWICTFREEPSDRVTFVDDRYKMGQMQDTEHLLQSWQLSTLVLLATAIFTGITSMICAFVSSAIDYCRYRLCLRVVTIVWIVLHCITGFLMGTGMIIFVRNSYDTKNRFILQITNRYEQEWGYSFWQAVTSSVIYAISIIFGITTVIITFAIVAREKHEYIKVHRDQYQQEMMSDV